MKNCDRFHLILDRFHFYLGTITSRNDFLPIKWRLSQKKWNLSAQGRFHFFWSESRYFKGLFFVKNNSNDVREFGIWKKLWKHENLAYITSRNSTLKIVFPFWVQFTTYYRPNFANFRQNTKNNDKKWVRNQRFSQKAQKLAYLSENSHKRSCLIDEYFKKALFWFPNSDDLISKTPPKTV